VPDTGDSWTVVRGFIQRRCGVVLGEDQRYLLDARLGPIARRFRFRSIAEYVQAACASDAPAGFARSVVDAMTTHETYFFRDPTFWRALEERVLPSLFAAPHGPRPIRAWLAGCATGQEAYSLAMLLDERWEGLLERCELLASDVSELSIERAREGRFSALEMNRGLGAHRVRRHFTAEAGRFRAREHLRRITWFQHNLLGPDPDPAGCDLVFCRNVLIYFDERDRAAALRRLFRALAPTGFLALGGTELLRCPPTAPGWYAATAAASV
jgi:chemotaxis protein methyltransferase CheR